MTRRPAALLLAAGLLPSAAWLAVRAAGWTADLQLVSGTLPDGDLAAATLRALVALAAWGATALLTPPAVAAAALCALTAPRPPPAAGPPARRRRAPPAATR